ncbi:hypothetical protein CP966_18590 [Streptomyces galilaeus]|nr:hypothetical protein CP966_18590 [Streptomyces galilaeus]
MRRGGRDEPGLTRSLGRRLRTEAVLVTEALFLGDGRLLVADLRVRLGRLAGTPRPDPPLPGPAPGPIGGGGRRGRHGRPGGRGGGGGGGGRRSSRGCRCGNVRWTPGIRRDAVVLRPRPRFRPRRERRTGTSVRPAGPVRRFGATCRAPLVRRPALVRDPGAVRRCTLVCRYRRRVRRGAPVRQHGQQQPRPDTHPAQPPPPWSHVRDPLPMFRRHKMRSQASHAGMCIAFRTAPNGKAGDRPSRGVPR